MDYSSDGGFFVDEHSSSTAGKYNLAESVNEEFRLGIYNPASNSEFPPVFGSSLPQIPVSYLNSASVTLIRAADITANWIYAAVRDEATYPDALAAVKGSGRVVLSCHPFGTAR